MNHICQTNITLWYCFSFQAIIEEMSFKIIYWLNQNVYIFFLHDVIHEQKYFLIRRFLFPNKVQRFRLFICSKSNNIAKQLRFCLYNSEKWNNISWNWSGTLDQRPQRGVTGFTRALLIVTMHYVCIQMSKVTSDMNGYTL